MLAPKTPVAHSAATANTVPSKAVPTGCPSRPRSNACLMPIKAGAGKRARAAARPYPRVALDRADCQGGQLPAPPSWQHHRQPAAVQGSGAVLSFSSELW